MCAPRHTMSMASLDTISTVEEESSVAQRLLKVKAAVRKATHEALRRGGSDADQPFSAENTDPNASFHLGMELFGQEVGMVERAVQEKLLKLEVELERLLMDAERDGAFHDGLYDGDTSTSTNATRSSFSPEELQAESDQLKTKIRFLKECSAARALLDESITMATPALAPNEERNLLTAAKLLVKSKQSARQAQEILEAWEEENMNSPAVAGAYTILDSVLSGLRRQKLDVIGRATALWHSCVSLTSNALAVRAPTDLTVAYDVLETFADDGTLEATLRKLTRRLQQEIFAPLLDDLVAGKSKAALTVHESEDRGAFLSSLVGSVTSSLNKGSVHRLEWTNQEHDILGREAGAAQNVFGVELWQDTLSFIQRVTVFVADHVLLQRSSLCDLVARRLFGKPSAMPSALNLEHLGLESCRLGDDDGLLLHPLLEAMDTTCIPRFLNPDELGQLRMRADELERLLDPFIEGIAAKNLLPVEIQTRLSAFSSSFEQKYVVNRRCVLLNEARDSIVSNDYHNTVTVGEDVHQNKDDEALGITDGMAIFKLHKANISDTAYKLMVRCRQVMDEAVKQHAITEPSPLSLLPATLYRTAREMLDLFRAIIPVKHGQEIASVPRTAAVLHNDCVFFSHHCLTLGLEYKDRFPEALPDDARGRLLRQTCIFVDMVPLFRDLADRSLGDMLDAQAKQLVELVGERIPLMGEALGSNEILAEWSDAETALSAGLYHLRHLSQAWKPILSYDILNRSMCYLVDVMFTLFLDQVFKASDISSSACSFVHSLFQKTTRDLEVLLDGDKSGSRVWDRFSAVGRFMDMSIADIQVALSDGIFRSVTGPELSRLVTSCFDDTPKRRILLKLLASNQ